MSIHAPRHLGRLAVSSSLAPAYTRSFACTAKQCSVPPQSPEYIIVPKPPLSEEKKPERVRGSLPVPRDVFPHADDARKLEERHIKETYPYSEKEPSPATLDPNHPRAWKRLMGEARRSNLRSGLKDLWDRKEKREAKAANKARTTHGTYVRAGRAPERTDEFLTRTSILEETLKTEVVADPLRFQKADVSRQMTAEKMTAKREERRDAIMELYNNARHFITEEKEFEAEVDRQFSENFWRDPARNSAWHEWGNQSSIYDMVGRVVRDSPAPGIEQFTADYARNVRRQKRTAEELTGGRIPDREA